MSETGGHFTQGQIQSILDRQRRDAAELARLRDAHRWIPVGERLPGYWEEVPVQRFEAGRFWKNFGAFDGTDWWRSGTHERLTNVTHWTPLPPEPEK